MHHRHQFKFILALVAAITFGVPSAYAYRVLVHVGHAFSAEELQDAKGWMEVAARADGVWAFNAWIRTIKTTTKQNQVLSYVKSRTFYLAEFHWSPAFVGDKRLRPNPVIDAGHRNGFHEIWCMTYDEARYGSTLSTTQIRRFRELYPGYKLISNIRVFNSKRFVAELAELDGVSYEFNALSYHHSSQHHERQTKLENVVEAIIWCLNHGKAIFLLIPPGDDRPAEENRYILAMQRLLLDLDTALEDRYFLSDCFILVPATYNCIKRKVHNTPEKHNGAYANTGMGATLAAIDYRDQSNSTQVRQGKKDPKERDAIPCSGFRELVR